MIRVEPRLEITWFKNNFGGVVPNTVYCPACSTLTEYNAKWGEVQEKRNPTEKDYCFEVGYDQDGDELHARCLKCNFDLRQEAPTVRNETETKGHERKQVTIKPKMSAYDGINLDWTSKIRGRLLYHASRGIYARGEIRRGKREISRSCGRQ